MAKHNEASFRLAVRKNQAVAFSRKRWMILTSLSHRELADLVCHFAAHTTGEYEKVLYDDGALLARINEEIDELTSKDMF